MKRTTNQQIACTATLTGVLLYVTVAASAADHAPLLEYKHLSDTSIPQYSPVKTKDGQTLYAAQEAILDPIGFADVVPSEDGNGIIITVTTAASKRIRQFTTEHVHEMIGVFLDGKLVHGPLHIAAPLSFSRITFTDELPAPVRKRMVEAWAARLDTSPGKHKYLVSGAGIVEAQVHHGSPGDVSFLHQGSIYGLPTSFLSRPELQQSVTQVVRVTVTRTAIRAGDKVLGTSAQAIEYIKATARPNRLVLVECSMPELDRMPKEEVAKLHPLFAYVHTNSPFVGLCQKMPDGWQWTTDESK